MKLRFLLAGAAALLAMGMVSGCAQDDTTMARFVRYMALQDGTRVAVVIPVQGDEEQTALTSISDLKPGESVKIHWTGRSWETPQWMPQQEVVSRVSR
jgi:hypothetical protein